jgi:hypothetical protein
MYVFITDADRGGNCVQICKITNNAFVKYSRIEYTFYFMEFLLPPKAGML